MVWPYALIKCLAVAFEGPAGSAWLPKILGALPSKLAARDLGNRISYATNSYSRSLDITEVLIFYSTESAIFVLGQERIPFSAKYQGQFPGPKEKATRWIALTLCNCVGSSFLRCGSNGHWNDPNWSVRLRHWRRHHRHAMPPSERLVHNCHRATSWSLRARCELLLSQIPAVEPCSIVDSSS